MKSISAALMILSVSTAHAFADGSIDRLRDEIVQETNDSLRIGKLLELSAELRLNNFDSARNYSYRALSLAKKLDSRYLEALSLQSVGGLMSDIGDYTEALRIQSHSRQIFNSIGDRLSEAKCLNEIGLINYHLADYSNSITCLLPALKVFEEMNYKKGMSAVYMNLSSIYNVLGDYANDIFYSKNAAELYKKTGNISEYASCLNNIADTYNRLGDYDNAIIFLHRSIEIKEKLKVTTSLAYSYATLYESYELKGIPRRGKSYLDKSFKIFSDCGNKEGLVLVNRALARYIASERDYKTALDHSLIAYLLAREAGMKREEMEICSELSAFYAALKMSEKSNYFKSENERIRDSILNNSVSSEVMNSQVAFSETSTGSTETFVIENPASKKFDASNRRISIISLSVIALLALFQISGLIYYINNRKHSDHH